MNRIAILMIAAGLCGGCASSQGNRVVTAATPAQKEVLLDRVKSLAGTWEMVGQDGQKATIVYQVSAKGSAVREIMFPGSEHEMTNMYTMDGPDLLMTHYCAMGNQPHMRAAAGKSDRIEFKTAGVSNLTAADQMFMGQMTLVFVDANHIRQEWRSIKDGKLEGDHAKFDLTRRQ